MIWATNQTTRDPMMVAYWQRVLHGLAPTASGHVYELYFPEEVHACLRRGSGRQGAGLRLFDLVAQAALPGLSAEAPGERRRNVTALPEATRLKTLRAKFEELHDGTHPLRIALDKLATLATIRIIEGKA